jgi:Spy/CpxP family protein refolding chaperone
MNSVSKNIWLVRAAAVVVFLLGFAAGALAPAVYSAWVRDRAQDTRQDRFEQMSERLKLNPEQKTQVQQIFGETRSQLEALRKESEPRFAEIRRQADERLRQTLTPEQWQQFQQARDEMHPRGRHREGEEVPRPTTEH